jgi:CD109 antigen
MLTLNQLSQETIIQDYTLIAHVPHESLTQSVTLYSSYKRYIVLIQTDKPMYKPGDTVNFRVLTIDAAMMPYKVEGIQVEVIDPFDNVIDTLDPLRCSLLTKSEAIDDTNEEEIDITDIDMNDQASPENGTCESSVQSTTKFGVVSHSFKIGKETNHGIWTLRVTTSEKDEKDYKIVTDKHFEVKEYVLPRFEVLVTTKHDVTLGEGSARLTISGRYTFGKLVKGVAKIKAESFNEGTLFNTAYKSVSVESKKTVEFDIRNELKVVNGIHPYRVKFEVDIKEDLTGQTMKKDVEIRIYRTGEFSLQLETEKRTFKPGFPYNLKVLVRQFDGKLALEQRSTMTLQVDYFYKPLLCSDAPEANALQKYQRTILKSFSQGMVEFSLDVPENTTAMAISASYLDIKTSLNVPRHESRSRENLIIKSATPKYVE